MSTQEPTPRPRTNERADPGQAHAGLLRIEPAADGHCLIGEVDMSTVDQLQAVLAAHNGSDSDLHLHLDELWFIDVGGTTALVQTAAELGPGRRLLLHNPPRQLQRILRLGWGDPDNVELMTS